MTPQAVGNRFKYESYKEAWKRIAASRQAGFFLEAIAIEESIIADRLISYLSRPNAVKPISKNRHGRWPGLGKLISELEAEAPDGITVGGFEDIVSALNAWKDDRNAAVHAIVKSDPGAPTSDIHEFLRLAEKASEQGEALAKAISSWHKSMKRLSANG